MNCPPARLSNPHADVLQETALGQICGSPQLFRDRYEILRILGRGGFGVTFLAKDITLPWEPLCVIKQLCPKVNNPDALQRARMRFHREAAILSKLGSHSQIPSLIDYFEVDGEFYLVQEYIRGVTLAKEVRRSGPWSEEAVKQFLREILPLLQYVHQNCVIHRDIKPPNLIRCRDDGRLVLIDFGAVKEQIAQAGETSCRHSTQFVGTVGFAPPEQFALRPVYSSDIFAVGVTCLYLLTGERPVDYDVDTFTGDVRWRDMVTVSDHLGKVLDKMLKSSLRERYQSAQEVLRALDLETHLDSLAQCMNVQRRPAKTSPWGGEEDSAASAARRMGKGYASPTDRTASAIRDWRARAKAREVWQYSLRRNTMMEESTGHA